jgi:hypothetical protein
MLKTTQVAADRAHDQTKTVLPAEVARGVYMQNAPSLKALKLMHLMIATAGGRMAEPVQHEMRLSDIRKIDGLGHHTHETLKPLFGELRAATLIHDDTEKKRVQIGGILDVALLDYRHEVSGDTLLTWYFSRMFTAMAEQSNHWAIMDRQAVFHLGSKYSVLLFQHISSLTKLDHVTDKNFTVPELRAMFGVPDGKLPRFADLNRRALEAAITEINQLSRLTLTATAHKIGRTVASVTISWEEKPLEQKKDTRRELDRPKVGRKARRDGTAATPVLAFPKSGSLKGTEPWDGLARTHVTRVQGGHIPDLRGLTDAFRNWCEAKAIPLDAKGIDRIFTGFCKTYRPII